MAHKTASEHWPPAEVSKERAEIFAFFAIRCRVPPDQVLNLTGYERNALAEQWRRDYAAKPTK